MSFLAWSPFRRRTKNTRLCWNYEFEWTSEHLTPDETNGLKHTYDVLADECLLRLNEISPPHRGELPRNHGQQPTPLEKISESKSDQSPLPHRDLYALLCDHHMTDPKLHHLWEEVNTVPSWVDWAQIKRGQDVFYRYGGPALTGLTYQSLLGGMGAARVVETLARTGGFSIQVARRRLFETTQHILQCTKSLESIQPGGEGFASSIRVRLLHAAVRQRIMKLAQQRPGYYNIAEWGVPINHLDQIGTVGTFSATLLWISFPRQGIFLRDQEKTDYIALWRYIGYLLGTPDELLSSPTKAKAIMESLLYSEVRPSETSKILAINVIHAIEGSPPTYVSPDMLIASARWLNGNELADELGLPRVSLYYWALMAGQCLFFMGLCYFYRFMPSWDRSHIERVKKVFWAVIVEAEWGLAGTETLFDFKYVPEYHTVTSMGQPKDIKLRPRIVETQNLKALCVFAAALSVGTWASYLTISSIIQRLW